MVPEQRILDSIAQSEENCILATIIQVEGSAYLKEGSSMLIMENGDRIGMLSGGCLEQDIFFSIPTNHNPV